MDQAMTLRHIISERQGPSPLRIIAVTSGKGGVGKTNISVNLAVRAAMVGKRVLVIDADLGLANVEVLCGITPKFDLGHMLSGTHSMEEVLAEGPAGIRVLSAGSGSSMLSRLDDVQKMRFMAGLDVLEDMFDLVLIDTGAGIGDNVRFFVSGAQEALLVVNPEPTSLTDAYASVKILSMEAGVEHFNVVVNPASSDAAARAIFEKLSTVTRRFLKAKLRHVGFVPRDQHIHRAVMAQRPVIQLFPDAPASRAIAQMGDRRAIGDEATRGLAEHGLFFGEHESHCLSPTFSRRAEPRQTASSC